PPDRDTLHRILNERLRELGVWMIYGRLAQNENFGTRDEGVQYVVLDDAYIIDCCPDDIH
ncbi:MAG: hypothetical protein WBN09_13630, partial [Woeseiaceae bacterium]